MIDNQMQAPFSFMILTYNEEQHLPRLLASIAELRAPVFVLDSGSTDRTVDIATEYGAKLATHPFENHPLQWAHALRHFKVETPWIIGLDADQHLSPDLQQLLREFRNDSIDPKVEGIYFNRKNFFKGKWIRYGGYFPKYMLKMFRTGKGSSSLEEKLDHRFAVTGESVVWKTGYLIEENLKENNIGFWIEKHNRYSDLVARDEFERSKIDSVKDTQARANTPDQQVVRKKRAWRKMPLFLRPFLYFFYRYIFQFGFLDGCRGFIFHFLQGFWFRLVVDIKISELRKRVDK